MREPHVCGSGGAVEAAGDGVGLRVVGQDPAHAHAAPAEGRERLLEEGGAARATLVGQDGDVGVTAVVVDGDVSVLQPQRTPRMRPGARLGEARRHSLAAALGDAPELLHVEMQQVAGGVVLVADRLPGDAVQAVEPVEAAAPQHGVDRGAGDPERPLDAVRPESLRASHGADASLQLGRRAPGMRARGGAAVLEPCRSLRPEAPQPLGNGVAGDAEVARDLSLGPAGVHFPHELESGQRRQPRVTMGHEGVLSSLLRCFTHSSG